METALLISWGRHTSGVYTSVLSPLCLLLASGVLGHTSDLSLYKPFDATLDQPSPELGS